MIPGLLDLMLNIINNGSTPVGRDRSADERVR